jgi:hypothetical protein
LRRVAYDPRVRRLSPLVIACVLGLAGLVLPALAQPQPQPPAQPAGQMQVQDTATPHEVGHYAGVVPGMSNRPPAMPSGRRANRLVTWPGFQARADGASRFFVQTTNAVAPALQTSQGRAVVLLPNVRIHLRNNRRPLETRFFNTPVSRARVERRGRNVAFILDLRADVTPTVSTDVGPDGLHFVYVEFPGGNFLPPEATQPIEGRPMLQMGPSAPGTAPTQPPPPQTGPNDSTSDPALDDERPPGFGVVQ